MSATAGQEWEPLYFKLIKIVEQHPIIYVPLEVINDQYEAALTAAWEEVAFEMETSEEICKETWDEIKYSYVKIINLINDGYVPIERMQDYDRTRMLMLGNLNFMDPYVDNITDIPPHVHTYYNTLFDVAYITYKTTNATVIKHYVTTPDGDENDGSQICNIM